MPSIAANELKAKLEAGEPLELLDIREADEFEAWHIHGSRNLPVYDALKADRDEALVRGSDGLSKERSIVTVCRGGIISEIAARVLNRLGYDAHSLDGGMRGWGSIWTVAPIPVPSLPDRTVFQRRRNGKGCLSYLIGAGGRGVVVDPSVEVAAYLETAQRAGLRITHVLETHVHADHLSRARELCRAASAELLIPANQRATYPFRPLQDGRSLSVGGLEIEAVATPGHTSESTCYLLDGAVLFTGDTLFVDSVGRPDLEKGDAGAEIGARQLYRSLQESLFGRFDDLPFYPGHYGQSIGFDRSPIGSTLGSLRTSLDLDRVGETEFVARILAGLRDKPANYESILAINEGRAELGEQDANELEAGPNSCAAG